jgi:hypothetical protein
MRTCNDLKERAQLYGEWGFHLDKLPNQISSFLYQSRRWSQFTSQHICTYQTSNVIDYLMMQLECTYCLACTSFYHFHLPAVKSRYPALRLTSYSTKEPRHECV